MMLSRYTFMKPGISIDTDGSQFPDPLTLNYNDFHAMSLLTPIELSETDIQYFWKLIYSHYGTSELDYIVLTLNGVSHKNFLREGQIIFIPAREDVVGSFTIKKA